MLRVNEAIGGVMDFIRSTMLSDIVVNDYQTRLRFISTFCERNGIIWFSQQEVKAFTDIQMVRLKNGEINGRHFRRLKRSAFLLAVCTQGKELTRKNVTFPARMLSEQYEGIYNEYKDYLSHSLASSTIVGVMSQVRQFLLFLESIGVHSLSQLNAEHVKNFMQSMVEKCHNSIAEVAWSIREFMSFLRNTDHTTVNAERYLLRPVPSRKKVLPCFTEPETAAILAAVDKTTVLGKRDYAIIKLAVENGLRGVDIFSLQLKDINWRKCEINVVQSKTDEPIQLPLQADGGNAVADYILHARPVSSSPYVFLRSVRPYTKLGNTANGKNIISRYLNKAGVVHEAWDGKTFHAIRRSQGTRLVEAEVPLPDVAEMLGHRNIESAKRYISLNDEKMRVCCLDISEYATRKEGLA
jgi:site-specific recombinase XerD